MTERQRQRFDLVIAETCEARLLEYRDDLRRGAAPGQRLSSALPDDRSRLSLLALINALLATKQARIYAESEILGDGSDWTLRELSLLGDLLISMPVTVFDNGQHCHPAIHESAFNAGLLFVPGALLRNDQGKMPADWPEVVRADGTLSLAGYRELYQRRLVPAFAHINALAARAGHDAVVTIPGIGCGQLAGAFKGCLGTVLQETIASILLDHGNAWPAIQMVYYDPFSECVSRTRTIHHIQYRIEPLLNNPEGRSQLCHPADYLQQPGEVNTQLYSLVAWDHVSWPGNDFIEVPDRRMMESRRQRLIAWPESPGCRATTTQYCPSIARRKTLQAGRLWSKPNR